jgi:hypothetical protein
MISGVTRSSPWAGDDGGLVMTQRVRARAPRVPVVFGLEVIG